MSKKGNENDKIAIVVPIYKSYIDSYEKISLTQLFAVLKSFCITFIIPKGVNINNITDNFKPDAIIEFDKEYFRSAESYSRLLLQKKFYANFSIYHFVLIYQLDAFVFYDKLSYFCSLGYDYIGAPMPICYWPGIRNRIGNGGFSLRKIDSFMNLLDKKDEVLALAREKRGEYFCEDLLTFEDKFFGFAASQKMFGFTVPPLNVAYRFALENDVANRFSTLGYQLPFGCHRWYGDNFSIWKTYIESYGYRFYKKESKKTLNNRYKRYRLKFIMNYLIARMARTYNVSIKKQWEIMKRGKYLCIWGYGDDGKKLLDFMNKNGVNIQCVYDKKFQNSTGFFVRPIKEQVIKEIANQLIVIASRKYYREIKNELESWGLRRYNHYISFYDFFNYTIRVMYPFWRKYYRF